MKRINFTPAKTSTPVRVLRENPLVREADNLNRSRNQAIEHKANKQAGAHKHDCAPQNTQTCPSTLLSISKASAAALHPHLGAAFEETNEPTGAGPKSRRKEQNSAKHNP